MDYMKQRTLYIDTRRCMGCRACETVCKLENDLPAGPRYTMVTEVETGEGLDEMTLIYLRPSSSVLYS